MVELRWAIPEHTTAQTPRLQYRQYPAVLSLGAPAGWSDWQDVPVVVVPQEPRPAAVLTASIDGLQRQIIDGPAPSSATTRDLQEKQHD